MRTPQGGAAKERLPRDGRIVDSALASNGNVMATRYTLIVGTKDWSSWSLRAYMAMRATGAPFDEQLVQLRQQPLTGDEIRKFSKAGRVPVLKIADDGRETTVWD